MMAWFLLTSWNVGINVLSVQQVLHLVSGVLHLFLAYRSPSFFFFCLLALLPDGPPHKTQSIHIHTHTHTQSKLLAKKRERERKKGSQQSTQVWVEACSPLHRTKRISSRNQAFFFSLKADNQAFSHTRAIPFEAKCCCCSFKKSLRFFLQVFFFSPFIFCSV